MENRDIKYYEQYSIFNGIVFETISHFSSHFEYLIDILERFKRS
jgi:hypothetical protein